jgi:hypothetical protein
MYMQKPDKSKSKMKLFSKPKSIGIVKDKPDFDKKHPALPSPGKMGPNRLMMNSSTTSLVDPNTTSTSSLYSSSLSMPQYILQEAFLMVEW